MRRNKQKLWKANYCLFRNGMDGKKTQGKLWQMLNFEKQIAGRWRQRQHVYKVVTQGGVRGKWFLCKEVDESQWNLHLSIIFCGLVVAALVLVWNKFVNFNGEKDKKKPGINKFSTKLVRLTTQMMVEGGGQNFLFLWEF